jgi:hypothetical protein
MTTTARVSASHLPSCFSLLGMHCFRHTQQKENPPSIKVKMKKTLLIKKWVIQPADHHTRDLYVFSTSPKRLILVFTHRKKLDHEETNIP